MTVFYGSKSIFWGLHLRGKTRLTGPRALWLCIVISELTGHFPSHCPCQSLVMGTRVNTTVSSNNISMPTASRPSMFLIASGAYSMVLSNHNSTPRSKKQLRDSHTPNIPPMAFFSGASNVKITGGEFNEVRGNYIVYDQSRHHSNVNSFNTTNHSIVDSANDNSRVYREPSCYLSPQILADLRCD